MEKYISGLGNPWDSIRVKNPTRLTNIVPPKIIEYTWAQKRVIDLRYKKFRNKQKLARFLLTTIAVITIPIWLGIVVLFSYLIDRYTGCSNIAGMIGIQLGILYFYIWTEIRFRWFGILDNDFYGYFV